MDQTFRDQNEEKFLIHEIPDEELEVIGMEKANTITQWLCTALNFCPAPNLVYTQEKDLLRDVHPVIQSLLGGLGCKLDYGPMKWHEPISEGNNRPCLRRKQSPQ